MNNYEKYKKLKNNYVSNIKQSQNEIKNHIEKISKHRSTKKIKYEEYKSSFDYVDGIFPGRDLKDVTVYLCSPCYLNKLGYKGIGGFFERVLKTIVIPEKLELETKVDKEFEIKARISIDEVLVHELLHYVSNHGITGSSSLEREEEFAYGYSVNYLRSKGHSDDYIINYNFMPFFYQITYLNKGKNITQKVLIENGNNIEDLYQMPVSKQKNILKKYKKEIYQAIRKEAYNRGKQLIELYTNNYTEEPIAKDDTFNFIDF